MDDPEELFEKFLSFMKNSGVNRKYPTTQNPSKYVRSIKLEGEKGAELLLKLTELKMKEREMNSLIESLHIIFHDTESIRGRFFKMAQQVFPLISEHSRGGGEGWREWKGDYYYVSWDGTDEDDEGK